jgi:two-component system, cell cycle sensor histidine kinase and response regulator CckA
MPGQIAETGVGIKTPAALNYRDKMTAIRDSLGGPRIEMLGRFVLPGLGVSLVAMLTADLVLALVYLFFLLTQGLLFGFLASRGPNCSRTDYVMTLCLAALTSCAFVAMSIYMWSTQMLVAQFAAYSMVTGFAIYGLTRSYPIISLMIIDTVAILIGALYAASSLALTMSDQVHPVVTLAIALMILTYYVVSLYNVYDTKTKLRRAEDRAIAVERLEAVGRLTGGVAHDFNNILTAVMGHLDLYGHLTSPAEKDSCVAAAHQAATRAAKLTTQLLFFARKARLTAVATDLTDYLTAFADRARDFLPEHIILRTILPRQLPPVMVDRDNLEIVLLQLVLNARDAMGEAGNLTLALDQLGVAAPRKMQGATELSPGAYCVIRVEDDGIGISPTALNRIFEPFFTTKTKGQASGLGLPMAAGFAEMSGGAIAVSSDIATGTMVSLFLPVIGTP